MTGFLLLLSKRKVVRMRFERLFLPMFAIGLSLSLPLPVQAEDHPDLQLSGAEAAHSPDTHSGAGSQAGEESHGGTPNPLAIDIDLAIWTGVVFASLFFVLNKFAWPSISTALEEREKRIASDIAEAQAMHEESKNMLAQHEAKLATAADEVRELLDEARRDAEHTKSEIIAEAKEAAGKERDRAVRDVDLAAEKAMHNLVETSANMAVDLAGQVVKQNITPDQQAALVRDALSKLASSSPSKN